MRRIVATLEDSLVIIRYVLAILFILMLFTILFQTASNNSKTDRNYDLGRENNTYLRTMVCISSVSPTKRTPDYVKLCYLLAEKHNNTVVEHFGDGK